MARKFRISIQLVSKLVVEARRQPEKLRDMKAKEKKQREAMKVTEQVASEMLKRNKSIRSCQQVQIEIKAQHQIELSKVAIRHVMRKELGLGYRTSSKVPIQANS